MVKNKEKGVFRKKKRKNKGNEMSIFISLAYHSK